MLNLSTLQYIVPIKRRIITQFNRIRLRKRKKKPECDVRIKKRPAASHNAAGLGVPIGLQLIN